MVVPQLVPSDTEMRPELDDRLSGLQPGQTDWTTTWILPGGTIAAANTGGLIKTGDGTLTLTAANLYGGTTTISTGTVVVGNNSALSAGTVRFLGGTIQGDGTARTLTNPVGLSGTMTIGGASDLTFSTGTWTLESATRTFADGMGNPESDAVAICP